MNLNRRKAIAMTRKEELSFLQNGGTLCVATKGPHGFPHLSAMWYWMVDDRIHFNTYRKSQKTVNLQRDPQISCMLEKGRTYETLRGLVVQGTGHIIDDPEQIRDIHRHRLPAKSGNPLDSLSVERRKAIAAKRIVVRVEPKKIYSWDHHKLGGRY